MTLQHGLLLFSVACNHYMSIAESHEWLRCYFGLTSSDIFSYHVFACRVGKESKAEKQFLKSIWVVKCVSWRPMIFQNKICSQEWCCWDTVYIIVKLCIMVSRTSWYALPVTTLKLEMTDFCLRIYQCTARLSVLPVLSVCADLYRKDMHFLRVIHSLCMIAQLHILGKFVNKILVYIVFSLCE